MKKQVQEIKIITVKYLERYKLHIVYSDGKGQDVDFEPFLRHSQHSEIQKYLNLKKFKNFTLSDGELMWGDFDLVFPIIDLYKNKIN
ncbi:MAG: DUF2442 domain-containing protein [Bdellovibrionota bacterium]